MLSFWRYFLPQPLYLFQLNDTIRIAEANVILAALDAQTQNAQLRLYDGTRPSKGGTTTTLISTLTFNKPSFTQSNGILTLIVSPAISDSSAAATGTPTWARLVDGLGNFVGDVDVGPGKEVTLDNYNITITGIVNCTSGTITVGNA